MSAHIVVASREAHQPAAIGAIGVALTIALAALLAPGEVSIVAVVWSIPVGGAAAHDAMTGRLPDAIVLPGVLATIAAAGVGGRAVPALVGAGLLSVPMLIVHLTRPEGLGFGDVKYTVLLGAGVGTVAPPLVVPAFLLASVFHVVACCLVRSRGRLVPFGPALAVAAGLMFVAGVWRLP